MAAFVIYYIGLVSFEGFASEGPRKKGSREKTQAGAIEANPEVWRMKEGCQ